MKRILAVFGTRPESLKLWPIIKLAREEYADSLDIRTYFTRQSEEKYISDIEPDYAGKCSAGVRFGQIYMGIESFLDDNTPDAIMVHGDTFSTLAGAQAAYFRDIPVIHVEAGLRTFRKNPWPEEMIRCQVDRMAWVKFSPNVKAEKCLQEELGEPKSMSLMTGNTIIDRIGMSWPNYIDMPENMIICQLHRRESWEQFETMMRYLGQVFLYMADERFSFLSHPNGKVSGYDLPGNVRLITALEYPDMMSLLAHCKAVITDSGGLIEEAAYFKKPCFILRDETERMESVEIGLAKLIGRGKDISAIPWLIRNLGAWFNPEASCPYGDGQASRRILEFLKDKANWP